MKTNAYIDEDGLEASMKADSGARARLPEGADPGPAVGDVFPDLTLPTAAGGMLDLHADRAGQKAAVMFYRSAVW